jgi:phage-related protein (TIGR01555 family)
MPKQRRVRQGKVSIKRIAQQAAKGEQAAQAQRVRDSFQNFVLSLGMGTDNALSDSTYGYNPITRQRILLDWIHRGSWLGGVAVDLVADDMTRAGVDFLSDIDPEDQEALEEMATALGLWNAINDTIKWSRLYGGCIAVLLIDGQDPSTPLRIESVGKGQFKGLFVLDRWMVEPSLEDLVTEMGPSMGLPKFYTVVTEAPALRNRRIHYSRVLRLEGIRLPYWQRITENMWGLSVLERIYDRMVAFDSATTGAAQLVYKSFLRTLKIKDFRAAVAAGGDAMNGIVAQVQMMRRYQSQEGVNLIDAEDDFQVDDHGSFSGIAEALMQFGQQLSGALQVPLVRLFGQSPAGLNSTGDSDLRTYYDGINQQQVKTLKVAVTIIYRVLARSMGINLSEGFGIAFKSLWQMSDKEKADTAEVVTRTVDAGFNGGIIGRGTALKELKQASEVTGVFASITDEEITEAEAEGPPQASEVLPGEEEDLANAEKAEGEEPGDRTKDGLMPTGAGTYTLGSFQIVVETPKGDIRKGNGWESLMPADYGYIMGTSSSEGPREQMDVYVGPNHKSTNAWIVHQRDLTTGDFDEHKVMLGYDDFAGALGDYVASFSDGKGMARVLKVDQVDVATLATWLRNWRYNGDDFNESQHPRAGNGEFTSGGGGGSTGPKKAHFKPGQKVRTPNGVESVWQVSNRQVETTRGNRYDLGKVRSVQ